VEVLKAGVALGIAPGSLNMVTNKL
jgi:hypothetical protein